MVATQRQSSASSIPEPGACSIAKERRRPPGAVSGRTVIESAIGGYVILSVYSYRRAREKAWSVDMKRTSATSVAATSHWSAAEHRGVDDETRCTPPTVWCHEVGFGGSDEARIR